MKHYDKIRGISDVLQFQFLQKTKAVQNLVESGGSLKSTVANHLLTSSKRAGNTDG